MRIIVDNRTQARLPPMSLYKVGRAAETLLHLTSGSEVTVAFVSSKAMRALNRRSRGSSRTTDVLSFPLHARRPFRRDPDGVVRLGDIVVSLPTAARKARERGLNLRDELRELVVHGLLHLVGYDHDRPKNVQRMRRAEDALLSASEPRSP